MKKLPLPVFSKSKPTLIFSFTNNHLKPFSTSPPLIITSSTKNNTSSTVSRNNNNNNNNVSVSVRVRVRTNKIAAAQQLKENWLDSLTCPIPSSKAPSFTADCDDLSSGSGWVLGIDPDVSGALALLKFDNDDDDAPVCSAQVFDSPHLKVMIGQRIRKRLDARSMIQLLRSLDVPIGSTAYIEQSLPFPKDGKQGWWSSGFGYGLWIGILVASGFSVIPVPPSTWKNEFSLTGSCSKDDSRNVASMFFPSLSPLLKRKKDHGRAEALLIAAYGKGMKMKSSPSCSSQEMEKTDRTWQPTSVNAAS